MHNHEVTRYKYSLRGGDLPTTRAWLQLYDDRALLAHVLFMDQPISQPGVLSGTTPLFYYRNSELQRVIDLLRNEEPVYLHYSESGGSITFVQIGTSIEPVGEEEHEVP